MIKGWHQGARTELPHAVVTPAEDEAVEVDGGRVLGPDAQRDNVFPLAVDGSGPDCHVSALQHATARDNTGQATGLGGVRHVVGHVPCG